MRLLLLSGALLVAGAALGVAAVVRVVTRDTPVTVSMRAYGRGADRVWVFEPDGRRAESVVFFVHGAGDEVEDTPNHYLPWFDHLAREGNVVLYPQYERVPGQGEVLSHLVKGLRLGAARAPPDLPVVGIGFSRGARLVVEYAAVAKGVPPVPDAILSIFPAGGMDKEHDLRTLADGTRILILAGDRDEVVGVHGANQLVTQLATAGFPYKQVRFEPVRSHGSFVASHLSVMAVSPAARAAFWDRADRLIESVRED